MTLYLSGTKQVTVLIQMLVLYTAAMLLGSNDTRRID